MSVLLDDLVAIALQAGRAIMDVYATEFSVARKHDDSLVTEADLKAEEIILGRLAEAARGVPVVAEEAASRGDVPEVGATFFLVDPLDGTREFTHRTGDFTVNIALIERGEPVMGIVLAPALNRLWAACAGEGAFTAEVSDDQLGPRRQLRVRSSPPRPVALASRFHRSPETDIFLERAGASRTLSRGSSLKFCLIAAGEADIYPRFGRTMEWDTAAGDAILRTAGGFVTTFDGQPLRYGKRNQPTDIDFSTPLFLACGDRRLVPTDESVVVVDGGSSDAG